MERRIMMKRSVFTLSFGIAALSIIPIASVAQGHGTVKTRIQLSLPPDAQLEQFIDQIESLRLVRNKVYLYRQAADALAASQRQEATDLLVRAFTDLESAQESLRDQRIRDPQQMKELDFAKRPLILQLIRVNQSEGLHVLEQPQTADSDTEFQRLVFEQLASTDVGAAQASALRKLSSGATPAAVAAYAVLQQRDPAAARVLATDIVARLASQDPAKDLQAVQTAFSLLRLLRSDEGVRATHIVVNQALLDDASIEALFGFIGDALLSAKEPELLILPERPQLYLDALGQYAPAKAEQVKLLPFAQPNARSLIFSQASAELDQPTPPVTPLPQQRTQQAAFLAQLHDAAAEIELARTKVEQSKAPPQEVQTAVAAAIVEANKSFAMGRMSAASLQPEAFRDNEYEFYNNGPLGGVLASISSLLEAYAREHRSAAFEAADQLESSEVQTAVELQLAIHLQAT